MVQTTEIYFLTVLEARGPRSRYQQVWLFLGSHSLAFLLGPQVVLVLLPLLSFVSLDRSLLILSIPLEKIALCCADFLYCLFPIPLISAVVYILFLVLALGLLCSSLPRF